MGNKNSNKGILFFVIIILFLLVTTFLVIFYFLSNQSEIKQTSKLKQQRVLQEERLSNLEQKVSEQKKKFQSGEELKENEDNQNKVSLTLPKDKEKRESTFLGRKVIGPNLEEIDKILETKGLLQMVNSYNFQWKKKLRDEILKFHPEGTLVEITVLDSYIQYEGSGKGRFVEKVMATTITLDGHKISFEGKIDSEGGEVIEAIGGTLCNRDKSIEKPILSGML